MGGVYGVGVDQILIERVRKACEKSSFLQKYYSQDERELIQKRASRAATNFAGKEAVAKALGVGFGREVSPEEVQILRRENGAPFVKLTGGTQAWAESHGVGEIHISLTDTEEYASAFAVAERSCEDSMAEE